MYNITALKALTDNYIWLIHDDKKALVIDPTLSEPVIAYLSQKNLSLTGILLTHSHADHTGGVNGLVHSYNPQIIDNFHGQLAEGQIIRFEGFPEFSTILTPGHMFEHVCYLFDQQHLFCGDTLFSLGCGRVFTEDYQAMFTSLGKLKALQSDSQTAKGVLCYPAHEYTMRNLEFTLAVDNDHEYYQQFIANIEQKLYEVGRSLPSYLAEEKQYNLFLRTTDKTLWQSVGSKSGSLIEDEFEYFFQLRLLRNNF